MQISGFYTNWSVFWNTHGTKSTPVPKTWQPIAKGLNRISYGFAIFGEYAANNGWVIEKPQKYSAALMYPGSVFTQMKKNGINDEAIFNQIQQLKKQNPKMKSLLAFGGWTFNDPGETETFFSSMMSKSASRKNFMDTAVALAKKFDLDGIEIDWEYPGHPLRGGKPEDFYNFEQFVKEFKQNHSNMILALDAGPFLSAAISIKQLPGYSPTLSMMTDDDYFHWLARLCAAGLNDIHVMTYDYSTAAPGGGLAYPNAPLKMPVGAPTKGCSGTTVDSLRAGPPANKVKIYGSSSAPTCLKDVLLMYNNLLGDGKTPDYDSFFKNNNISKPSNPEGFVLQAGKEYTLCGSTYTVKAGDTFYNICSKIYDLDNSPGSKQLGLYCGTLITYVAAYNKIANPTDIQPGNVIQMPVATATAMAAISKNKPVSTVCKSGPPTPSGNDKSIQNTVNGLTKQFKAAGIDMSKHVWCGLATYGRSYSGVDFSGATTPAEIAKIGKTYTGPAPGGFYSGNCGKDSCGTLTFREINHLLSHNGVVPCDPTAPSEDCHSAVQWNKLEGSVVDESTGSAVAYDTKRKVWISYDNEQSLKMKIDWLKSQNIKGFLIFSPTMDTSDFQLTQFIIKEANS